MKRQKQDWIAPVSVSVLVICGCSEQPTPVPAQTTAPQQSQAPQSPAVTSPSGSGLSASVAPPATIPNAAPTMVMVPIPDPNAPVSSGPSQLDVERAYLNFCIRTMRLYSSGFGTIADSFDALADANDRGGSVEPQRSSTLYWIGKLQDMLHRTNQERSALTIPERFTNMDVMFYEGLKKAVAASALLKTGVETYNRSLIAEGTEQLGVADSLFHQAVEDMEKS